MITAFLLQMVYSFVWLITLPLRLFANVSVESGLGGAIASASSYLANLDFIVPVDTFLTIIGITLTIEGGVIVYKIIMWIVRRIPAQG